MAAYKAVHRTIAVFDVKRTPISAWIRVPGEIRLDDQLTGAGPAGVDQAGAGLGGKVAPRL